MRQSPRDITENPFPEQSEVEVNSLQPNQLFRHILIANVLSGDENDSNNKKKTPFLEDAVLSETYRVRHILDIHICVK